MLNCRQVTEQASDYLERELSPWQRFQVRLHLFLCDACRRYAQQLAQTVALLKQAPREAPTPEAAQALLKSFRERHANDTKGRAGPS